MVDILGVLIGLLIPLVSIVLGIAVAFWSIYWAHQTKRLQYEERRIMIEKGMVPPPPALPERRRRVVTPEDSLRRGTIMVFLGIGLGIAYVLLRNSRLPGPDWLLPAAAPIVGLLGLGNLVYYFIAKKRKPEQAASSELG